MTQYSIKIIILDSYMCAPTQGLDVVYSEFRGCSVTQVPILRLFGSTESGEKICLHIHGVFPYFYIPYDGNEDVNSLMYQIAIKIDKAINISLNQASSNTQHVYKITLVSGIPMYGYHNKKHQFLKIYLYNPLLIRRVSDLLMNDAVLGKIYQPHETHLPFVLQFMIDYNLHGMSNLILSKMKFRIDSNVENVNVSPEIMLPAVVKKMSVCEVEGDALAEHILNRLEVASGNIGVNPGIAALWANEMQRRRNKGETSQIEHLLELTNIDVEPSRTHLIFKEALLQRLAITSTDQHKVQDKLNLSVYPAETPEYQDIENASSIDSQAPSEIELSLNDTTLTSADLNDTISGEQDNPNVTLDAEAQALLEILQKLEANVKENVEEDSILSQTVKEFEEDKDLDLSMPLEAITTPKKIIADTEDNTDIDDLWNTTLIPQLDGECDEGNYVKIEDHSEQLKMNNICDRRITRSYQIFLDATSERKKNLKETLLLKKAVYIKLTGFDHSTSDMLEDDREIKFEEGKIGRSMPLLDSVDDTNTENQFHFSTYNNVYKNEKKDKIDCQSTGDLIEGSNSIIEINKFEIGNISTDVTEGNTFELEDKKFLLKIKTSRERVHKNKGFPLKKTIRELKSWQYHFKVFKKRQCLHRMMKKIHDKEYQISLLLLKNRKPIFHIVPGKRKIWTNGSLYQKIADSEVDIISDILIKTKNYIDSDLHLTVLYPSNKLFFYVYNKNVYPEVTEVSQMSSKIKIDLFKNFIKNKTDRKNDYNHNPNSCELEIKKDKEELSSAQADLIRDCVKLKKINNPVQSRRSQRTLLNNNLDRREGSVSPIKFPRNSTERHKERSNQASFSNIVNSREEKNEGIVQFLQKDNKLNQESSKMTSLLNDVGTTKGESNCVAQDINNSVECLEDNDLSFKNSPKEQENIQINVVIPQGADQQERVHFLKEAIDSDNKKNIFIFSAKYLTDVKDNNLINSINDQSMSQIIKTLKKIKIKLEKHFAYANESIYNRNTCINNIKNKKCTLKNSNESTNFGSNAGKTCHTKIISEFNKTDIKYLSLDGTMDTSSSEDEDSKLKCKKSTKRKSTGNFLQYSALPVTVANSPCPSTEGGSPDKPLVSQNTNKKLEEKETLLNQQSLQKTCDIVKRRINFSNTSLQTTVIEEKLVCNYSPAKRKRSSKCRKHSNFTSEYDSTKFESNSQHCGQTKFPCSDNDENFVSTSQNKSDNINIPSIKAESNSNSSHCGIFSNHDSDDEENESFFKSPEITNKLNVLLTTAELYDKEKNFKAKEGTSKILTPHSCVSSQKSSDEIQHSSGSSSFDLPPPYQVVCVNQNLDCDIFDNDEDATHLLHNNSVINNDSDTSKVLIPFKKAPTQTEVARSLDKYQIPLVREKVPFYSNVEDVTGSVEVGYNVLKISSKSSVHLAEFDSQTDGLNNFRKDKLKSLSSNVEWSKSNVNNVALSFCKDRSCIIMPIKKPPSALTVKNWIKGRSKRVVTPEKKVERVKIFIPLSPGNNNDNDDMDISLTLSPCTPSSSQSNSQTEKFKVTPKSSKLEEDLNSTTMKRKFIKQKLSQSLTPSLRRSLLLSSQEKSNSNNTCQITGVSPNNTYGFDRSTENLQAARAIIEHELLTLLVIELHIKTRSDFKPNPEFDMICAIFYSVLNDVPPSNPRPSKSKGVIAINSLPMSPELCKIPILDGSGVDCNVTYVDSEKGLLEEFLKLVAYWNPDIFAGYEVEMLSWGYLIDRASILGMNFRCLLSRTNEDKKFKDESELHIVGRIVLDVWRIMKYEIALQSYTFESVIYHILHRRVPHYSFKDLSFWWSHRSTLYRYRTLHYYLFRVEMILELLDKLDIIGRTSELARLFGIQFYEVLSRGTQFRVESMMLRLAKPLNFIPVSPSVQQRATMKAPEYIPLILEPESKLYNDPVIVLDFQSLYPSIIIAYNYCFTTCVGRVSSLGGNTAFEFGATQLKVGRKRLEKLLKKDLLNFSPCGVGFVKKEVRDGILPRMLREILDTRLMVKNSMKENKDNQLLQKVLHNRQLGLKLIANVTYGYTAANFSGRMPSVEVGDSVVSKGRETLQRAIEMVDSTSEWGARVVYGDTDSLFVLVPGKSKEHAFEVGKKIADAVTKANPDPVKLKLEKVYQPCILQTKKRYVGYMYESSDQKEPVYDAKGIETVRRDGCPAVSKMLEKCLKLLFETKDVSLIKKYVLRQFNKILSGRASIQDLTFAKEYRGASEYRPGACVPSLELARKWTAVDKRNEPRRGERVPYIIVNGPPGLPLIRLVKSPKDLLEDPSLRPNALYYITKVIIPPMNRCFNLIGADLTTWYNQMPRKQIQTLPSSVSPGKKSTISQYFATSSCVACGEQTQTGICNVCIGKPQVTAVTLMEKLRGWERNNYNCNLICQSCCGVQTDVKCISLDCPILYRRIQTNRDVQQATYVRDLISSNDFLF